MEKKYLKQLTLGVLTNLSKPDELIEAYTFRFTYDESSTNLNLSLYAIIHSSNHLVINH
jgi:hypothetical protein